MMKVRILLGIIGVMAAIQLINMLFGYPLVAFGIVPRTLRGLFGILTAPWIHLDLAHLTGNAFALFVLGWLCLLHSVRYFTFASLFIIIVGGLLLWCFGRSSTHVGASGWIFGLWALLMANAYFERTLKNLAIGIVVLFFYGSLIFGLLPSSKVSFEGHIAGVISGILFAWCIRHNKTIKAIYKKPRI